MSLSVIKKIEFNSLPFERKREIIKGVHAMFTTSFCLSLFYECYLKDKVFDVKEIKFLSKRINTDLSTIVSYLKYKVSPADAVTEDKIRYGDASILSDVIFFFCDFDEDAQLRILEKCKEFAKEERMKRLL